MVSLSSTMSMSFSLNSAAPPPIRLRPPPHSTARFAGTRFAAKIHLLRLCSASSGDATRPDTSGFDGSSLEKEGSSDERDGNSKATSSNEMLARLKSYGISGILSYGLLNTAYYLTTFLVVWFYVSPAPTKMGYLAAVQRFLKVLAMVWAGSQVTKVMRAGGYMNSYSAALALAPFVVRGLSWFTVKFGFGSQGKAFTAIVGSCFGLAFLMFVVVTVLWA